MDPFEAGKFFSPGRRIGPLTRGAKDLEAEPSTLSVTSGTDLTQVQVVETAVTVIPGWTEAAFDRTTLTGSPATLVPKGVVATLRRRTMLSQDDIIWVISDAGPAAERTSTTSHSVSRRDASIDGAVQRIRSIREFTDGPLVAQRIEALRDLSCEELEGGEQLNPDSLLGFVAFLERERRINAPAISLTPDGNVYTSWRAGPRLLSVQFFPDWRASYVCFLPNARAPSVIDRRYVQTTIDQLAEELTRLGAREWLRHERS